LYQEAGVNPLAGCLPTLATLPVFIGLYRALTNAASDGLLTDGFFWIPSLGGPSSMGDNASGRGLGWLFPLIDGAPPIGWHDAVAYLVLPVLLVVSQFASQKIMQPNQNQDPSQASANAILKFLPFMVGWFSLNVPSGLTLYWIVNNVLTTAQTVYLRNAVASAAATAAAAPAPPAPNMYAPKTQLPPNPPQMSADSRAATPVNAEVRHAASERALERAFACSALARRALTRVRPAPQIVGGSGGDSARPGARFAALKAAEAAKTKGGKQKRQAQGNAPKSVNWAEGGDSKEE